MIAGISVPAVLACGYALVLLGVAYGIDAMAKRASRSARMTATTGFVYHEDHDAWLCPEDQWLWPTTFDPENRVMRYRGTPSICNSCPVKDTCTQSDSGREVVRAVDEWPASEAARFHRGIACAVVVMAIVWPIGMALAGPPVLELAVLLTTAVLVAVLGAPLFSHLRKSPSAFPDGVRLATNDESIELRQSVEAAEQRRKTSYWSESMSHKEN